MGYVPEFTPENGKHVSDEGVGLEVQSSPFHPLRALPSRFSDVEDSTFLR